MGVGLGELAGGKGANLSLEHGAVVPAGVHKHTHKEQGKDGVHVEGQALDVGAHGGDAVDAGGIQALTDHADLVSDPVGDEERGGRSGGGVQHIGELFGRNLVVFADITEHVAVHGGHQAVVDRAQHAQTPGSQTDRASLFESALGGFSQSQAAAQSPDEGNAHAHKQGEEEQDHIVCHVGGDLLQSQGGAGKGVPVAHDQRTGKQAGKHREQHLLGGKTQKNSHKRWDQCQDAIVGVHTSSSFFEIPCLKKQQISCQFFCQGETGKRETRLFV